ncbi:pyridoxal phosphate-dependent aminotransferase [Rubrobacter indicoceani]|uniref:pyridoxal phosphate-dependent aminotransferase n=1 Tax=Rubrobacter indicoceani TaxID=2051957 RepID=UPI0013C4952C|nr:histidinol-phosphate transaminase [Rubrobacter indicoceani]
MTDVRPGAVHGAPDFGELARLGVEAESVVDFSSNVNPYGPAPCVVAAFRNADIASYPDRECLKLRDAIAARSGVSPSSVVVGNGSAEIIDLVARTFLVPGDRALVVGPTFSEYERASALAGAGVVRFGRTVAPEGVSLDAGGLLGAIRSETPGIVWLCNPNNPTGDVIGAAEVESILRAAREVGATLVVDEAYAELVLGGGEPEDLTPPLGDGGLVLLRSMTKGHALAGLRLGYALLPPGAAERIERLRPPWMVSSPAQVAGVAALSAGAEKHLRRSVGAMKKELAYLVGELRELGLAPVPSRTNYLISPAGERCGSGESLRLKLLLEDGLLVRDCASFGLAGYVRLAVRLPDENRRLVGALRRIFHDEPDGSR